MLRDENTQSISCDLEPIHRPGSIQPHGLMLVARAKLWKSSAQAVMLLRASARIGMARPLMCFSG